MASIFISHSSLDKNVARQLANDLKPYGHDIWLDEWQIKIGQCIPTEIERGINEANFVVLLLSAHAVQSNWVDREWKAAYWDEVNNNSIVLLPVSLEECVIPKLLQTKKYADFSESYAVGFHKLVSSIEWYSETSGLATAYEKTHLQLPKIIRNSQELTVLTCRELKAKVTRMIGKPIVIKKAKVDLIFGPKYQHVQFNLRDNTDNFMECFVEQNTELEDVVIQQPAGNFYGVIEERVDSKGIFIVSEWEPDN